MSRISPPPCTCTERHLRNVLPLHVPELPGGGGGGKGYSRHYLYGTVNIGGHTSLCCIGTK